jgi:Concanavalin A-like lectin/glucanases superfamily
MRLRTRVAASLVGITAVVGSAALVTAAPAAEWPLSAYWPMLEGKGQTVRDYSGMGNHGRLGTSTGIDKRDANWVKGVIGFGSALRFDGNDYIAIDDDPSLHQQRLTVEAWARADGSPGKWRYIVSKGGDGCWSASYGLYTSINGGVAFYVYDGKNYYRSPQGSPAIWDGKWHHVAGTYDGSKVRLYVDGFEIGSGTSFSGKIWYSQPYAEGAIGAYRGSCNLTFVGDIDEPRIWRQALPVSKIWSQISSFLDVEPHPRLPEDAGEWYTPDN